MSRLRTWILACVTTGMGPLSWADPPASPVASAVSECRSAETLAVVSAASLPALLGKPLEKIRLLHYRDRQLSPVTLQIDQRDAEGRYRLDDAAGPDGPARRLGPDDEIVFRLADASVKCPPADIDTEPALTGIVVKDEQSGQTGWVYIGLYDNAAGPLPAGQRVSYDTTTDSVETDRYRIGFSHQHPFIIDRFNWRSGAKEWSPNVLDTMKIRHQGRMFGLLSFRRTTKDYSSRLVRVKTGPLRVIRRTENHVRIVWKLKTPALYVDYVMMPDSFVMDTIVDIPFNIGLFLRDVETLTTVDWRKDPALPELTIRSPGTASSLVVNGRMSDEKFRFNTVKGTRLSVHSDYGAVSLNLDIPDDFPIQPWLYLSDRLEVPDRPENQPGQFGNVGYRTTGWENIDSEVHHLKFTACLKTGGE